MASVLNLKLRVSPDMMHIDIVSTKALKKQYKELAG